MSNETNTTMETSNRHIEKTWTLNIPYANTTGRNNAKKIGATWNPDKKVWTVTTTEYKLDCKNLWKFVVEDSSSDVVVENASFKESVSKRWVKGDHVTPGHYAHSTGDYTKDVLSGFFTE